MYVKTVGRIAACNLQPSTNEAIAIGPMSNEPTNPGANVPNEHAAMLKAALQWHADMGVDAVVAVEPVDWLARADVPPGQEIRALLRPAAAQSKPSAASGQPAQRPAATQVSQGKSEASPTKRQYSPAPPDRTVTAARETAASISTLADLSTALAAFEGCGLKATAKNTCVFRGVETARLMVIGEAPGRDGEGDAARLRGGLDRIPGGSNSEATARDRVKPLGRRHLAHSGGVNRSGTGAT